MKNDEKDDKDYDYLSIAFTIGFLIVTILFIQGCATTPATPAVPYSDKWMRQQGYAQYCTSAGASSFRTCDWVTQAEMKEILRTKGF